MALRNLLHKIGIHDWEKEKFEGDENICFKIRKTCKMCGEIKEKDQYHNYKTTTHGNFFGNDCYSNTITTSCVDCGYIKESEEEFCY